MKKQQAENPAAAIHWTALLVSETKSQVRLQIDEWRRSLGESSALRQILQMIEKNSPCGDAATSLHCFVYCISALVHHERHGGLTKKQMEELCDLSSGVVKISTAYASRALLESLQSELHLVKSQVYRKSGDHSAAAWEQYFAFRSAGDSVAGGIAFHKFVTANRLMRLGYAHQALRLYQIATGGTLGSKLSETQARKVIVSRITLYRISGMLQQAQVCMNEAVSNSSSDEVFTLDLQWESACLDLQQKQDARQMNALTSRTRSHHAPLYIIEAVLWTLCLHTRGSLKKAVVLESLRHNKKLKMRQCGIYFEIVAAIQNIYDSSIAPDIRIQKLTSLVGSISEVSTIDKEILIWLAAARCFSRMRIQELAVLCLSRYESLSLTLSGGVCRDGLGLASDLLDSEWYTGTKELEAMSQSLPKAG